MDDLDDDSAAMAAAMGFSSFGNQNPPAKKRKFNSATDAFVSGDELQKIDRGGKKGQGSGGNNVPLGKMRSIGAKSNAGAEEKKNDEEIDLGDDEDEEEGVELGGIGAGAGSGGKVDGEEDEEQGPNYIDTSVQAPIFDGIEGGETARGQDALEDDPATMEEKRKAQERIDAILGSIPLDTSVVEQASVSPHGLPARPVYNNFASARGRGRGGGMGGSETGSSRPSRGGTRNEKWFEDYYDPSFNENPWARLEKEKGLQPVGTWVER